MATRKKSTGKQHSETDELTSYNIRFDYSETYIENEALDYILEEESEELNKEQYRKGVESEKIIEKVKQNVNKMLQLKSVIRNRDPNETSNRISKSARSCKKTSEKQKLSTDIKEQAPDDTEMITDQIEECQKAAQSNGICQLQSTKTFATRQLNSLTTFLLSVQSFKRLIPQPNKEERHDRMVSNCNNPDVISTKPSFVISKFSQHDKRSQSVDLSDVAKSNGKLSPAQYGIHVKKESVRSRRELEEISRLEHDSKFGYVNKYEERRKKLLAKCKDTKQLDDRIKYFLTEVDNFKKLMRDENSLENVLHRARSAKMQRYNTCVW